MWVRKIGTKGKSKSVVLPKPALDALGWEKGDHLLIYLHNNDALLAIRFDPEKRPDLLHAARVSEELEDVDLPQIKT